MSNPKVIKSPEDLRDFLNSIPEDKFLESLDYMIRNDKEDMIFKDDEVCARHLWADVFEIQFIATRFAASKALNPRLVAI